MAWTKEKTAAAMGLAVVLAVGTVMVGNRQPSVPPNPELPVAALTNAPAAPPPALLGTINFDGVAVVQTLEIYKKLTGLELTIAPEVSLCAGIYLHASQVDGPTATNLLAKALLEQAGVVITKYGKTASLTHNGKPVAHPCGADPPPPVVPK